MAKRNKNMLNLRIRGRQFQFYKRLSATLADHRGKPFYIKNLGTSDLMEAQIKRDEILLDLKKQENLLGQNNPYGIDLKSKDDATEMARAYSKMDEHQIDQLTDFLAEQNYKAHEAAGRPFNTPGGPGSEFWELVSGEVVPCNVHLDRFMKNAEITQGVAKQRRREIELFAQWLVIDDLKAVDRKVAAEYCEHLKSGRGLNGRSVNLMISHVSSYFKWLYKAGILTNPSPFTGLQEGSAKSAQRRLPWSHSEMLQLVQACGPHTDLEYAIRIAAFQGLRAIEVTGLKVGDCRDGWLDVKRTKTDAGVRTMPIHNQLDLGPLLERPDDQWLLKSYRGNKVNLSKLFSIHHKVTLGEQERVGPLSPKTYHSLRHAWITDRVRAGCDRIVLKEMAGHDLGSEGVTFSVCHHGASNEQKVQVVNAVKIEGL